MRLHKVDLNLKQKEAKLDQEKTPQARSPHKGTEGSKSKSKSPKRFLPLPRTSCLLTLVQQLQPACGSCCSLHLAQ